MSTAETPYAETEVLLAVLRDDEEAAIRLLAELSPRERAELQKVASRVETLAWRWCESCGQPIRTWQEVTSVLYLGGSSTHLYHRECRS